MDVLPLQKKEMQQEAVTTRKILERIPDDKLSWKPHEKSMSMQNLAVYDSRTSYMGFHGIEHQRTGFCKNGLQTYAGQQR